MKKILIESFQNDIIDASDMDELDRIYGRTKIVFTLIQDKELIFHGEVELPDELKDRYYTLMGDFVEFLNNTANISEMTPDLKTKEILYRRGLNSSKEEK